MPSLYRKHKDVVTGKWAGTIVSDELGISFTDTDPENIHYKAYVEWSKGTGNVPDEIEE